ncbi:MAG: hypothetical protein QNJ45_28105 [Ardenticatenaceae bacterium]|nr:hypothetical protein [Ardenticatenaceae bacterium]
MISVIIPDFGSLELHHLVMDYNGTLAVDGPLLAELKPKLRALHHHLTLHVVTADTFGHAREQLADLPCRLAILQEGNQAEQKEKLIHRLGPSSVVAIGNGRNDRLMVGTAALGLAVIQQEGAAAQTLMAADAVCTSTANALDLLLNPKRLIATLRS